MPTDSVTDGTRELDARTIGGEPFGEIMAALDELDHGETLILVNSFEPEPLYAVLARQGYDHETTHAGDDEWRVSITKA